MMQYDVIRFLSIWLALVHLGSPALADDTRERIVLTIGQAALVQSVAQSACFSLAGIDAAGNSQRTLEKVDRFETVLAGLLDGHDWLKLEPVEDTQRRAAITALANTWHDYGAAARQIVAGDHHTIIVRQILRDNASTVAATSVLADDIIGSLGEDRMPSDLARTLRLAENQKMLTQRAILEMCAMIFEVGGPEIGAQLRATLDKIEATQALLMTGGDGILPPPNSRIERNFRTAGLFWGKMLAVFEKVLEGERPSDMELVKLLKFNDSVTKQFNQALDAYLTTD